VNEKKTWTPIICVDFDGVLHSYTSGWKGAGNIPDPPVEGAIAWLVDAVEGGKAQIAVYSSRSKDAEGIPAMRRWLAEAITLHTGMMVASARILEAIQFPTEKPAAIMTIDDRAHCFMGRFRPIEWYLNFKPWNKRSPEPNIPDYNKGWSQDDEDLADQTLECILDCLTVDRDGFYTFEPSAQEFMAGMFMEARKIAEVKAASFPEKREGELRELLFEVLGSRCNTKALDDAGDRDAVLEELLEALRRF